MVAADSVLKRVLFLALRQDEVGSAASIGKRVQILQVGLGSGCDPVRRDLIIGERIPYETSRAGRIEYGSRRIIDLSLPHGSAAAIGTDLRSQQCREVACALRLVRNRGL